MSLHRAQRWPRVETELITEHRTRLLIDPQRVGLPPRSVERKHLELIEPLAEAVGREQLTKFGYRVTVSS